LLDGAGACSELVLAGLRKAHRIADPTAAALRFDEAMAAARAIGDRDLELYALSAAGRSRVAAGAFEAGFAQLDEAMAAVTAGELRDPFVAADASCNMLIACDRAADLPRAAQWCQVAEEWARRHRCLPFFAFCRISYGGVLYAQGRWAEAEDQLVDAARRAETTAPALGTQAAARLSELRVAQGELADAAALLAPWIDHPVCAYAAAGLELARGELDAAAMRLERRISSAVSDPTLLAPLCDALVAIELRRGDRAAAAEHAARLAETAGRLPSRMIAAMADGAAGAVAAAEGSDAAVTRLSRALDTYAELGMPYRAARAQLALARALGASRRDAAVSAAQSALATCERLGARPAAGEAADLLRVLTGGRPYVRRRGGAETLTPREREVLGLLTEGLSNPLIAERLDISPKTAEHHVCSILAKLDLKTRAAAAAWGAGQSPERKKIPLP
jgi:ATP/maltotriose-dependent transcriptional regulator MalT